MKWLIPAKTFLVGEYAALAEQSAIILTTTPYFELSLVSQKESHGIHPDSPAGIWWQKQLIKDYGLQWNDPYGGCGGLGASSAQFVASYLASCYLKQITPTLSELLDAYYQCAWSGKGLRPSGYDLIAQSSTGCVFINKQKQSINAYDWPFKDLSLILLHTGVKLATHEHLQSTSLPADITTLSMLAEKANKAFIHADSKALIESVNDYHQQLANLNLVAEHSLRSIEHLKSYPEILAIKGCGALGSDILLILTSIEESTDLQNKLRQQDWSIVATENNVTSINASQMRQTAYFKNIT